jgi:succinate-semialdehyde dehydrogenase/glutarate-semialdehyde dehydrogenase
MTGQCLEKCFRDAGYEEGEYQSLLIGKEATEQILSNFHVRGVSFTGSTDGGSQVAELAGKYIKKSVMELGGCDPCVVMKDADLNKAVEVVCESRLRNDGQVCSAIKRVIVEETIFDDFKNKLIEKLKQVPIGDPMKKENKVGPLGSERIYKRILEQLDEGAKAGAKILYGGKRPDKEECQKGYYLTPTVIECKEDNILSTEEVFGPVFTLLPYKDEKDALRIANSSRYGLGGVIISENRDNAEKFGKLLESGILSINENLKSDSRMPNGGIKDSGYGRDCGREGAREFVNVRSVRIS